MARLIWTEPALQDLEAIANYIALDNPVAAKKFVRRVFAKVRNLRKFPRIGSAPPEISGLAYRQLIVSPCRVFYRIEEKWIFIVHVMRSEQMLRLEKLDR